MAASIGVRFYWLGLTVGRFGFGGLVGQLGVIVHCGWPGCRVIAVVCLHEDDVDATLLGDALDGVDQFGGDALAPELRRDR